METTVMTLADANHDKFRISLRYPWLSLVLMLLTFGYGLLLTQPALALRLPQPQAWLQAAYWPWLMLATLVAAWADVRRFRRRQQQMRTQLNKFWQSRKQLQQRAQTSAAHTDKLKMFISDKLLEYIEYDEKYLHFRSIAAEVRHNGVISFDQVQSALNYAAAHSLPDEQGSNALMYQQALGSMRYLWDLLDLSTTDNMAMHISASISHCEELLFQAELQGTPLDELPLAPVFDPRQALLDTLRLHLGAQLCDAQGQPDPAVLYQRDAQQTLSLTDRDGLYRIELQPCDRLAGNANHLILLLENLLKNARYFATQKQYKSRFAPVAIQLWEQDQCLLIRLYNRGPHIREEDRGQIFQLGFSTRRARGHHGKGLGLYFVQQITQGFDGDIRFDNVHNTDDDYMLRIELLNGEVHNLQLQQRCEDGVPRLAVAEAGAVMADEWSFPAAAGIRSVEISSRLQPQVQRLAVNGATLWTDPQPSPQPRWQMQLSGRKATRLVMLPLDVRGVEFTLRLPTVSGRLEGNGSAGQQAPDVAALQERFRGPDDF